MKLLEITERETWDGFHAEQPWSQFTQSWAWGEFRASSGVQVRRFALFDDRGMMLVAAQMEYRLRPIVGGYWFAPRGPVFNSRIELSERRDLFRAFLEELLRHRLPRALFWRFEPLIELGRPEGLMPMRFRRAAPMNPAATRLIALDRSSDELLAGMHQKTRYNIRVAGRNGVTTRIGTHHGDLEIFLRLHEETAARDEFTPHGRTYLTTMVRALEREGMARIRIAEKNGTPLAANLEMLYGDTVTYLHGASSNASREVMAPYALHWDAITHAARDGFRIYDLWGENPESKAAFGYKPSWEGITRFKRGWGGRHVPLYGTWDLPLNLPLYRLIFWRDIFRG